MEKRFYRGLLDYIKANFQIVDHRGNMGLTIYIRMRFGEKKRWIFLNSIPNGAYVVIRTNSSPNQNGNVYIDQWKADTSLYGKNNSLYHKLVGLGFTDIDSFTTPRGLAFIYKKNDPSFIPKQTMTETVFDRTFISTDCLTSGTTGSMSSPVFGEAKKWKELHWRGKSLESPSTDSVNIQLYGIDTSGNSTLLYSLDRNTQDLDISSINVSQFPNIQLKLNTSDTAFGTPYQLGYWRLNYVPVPEGALAPNIFFTGKDTVELGEQISFGIAFKNISLSAFDSMKISLKLIDKNNVTHIIPFSKLKPLVSGDTIKITYIIDTKSYPGSNTLFLDVNPR